MLGRNKLGESQNVTDSNSSVTACDKGQGYQLCNDTSNSVAYLTCGDLFSNEYPCSWKNMSFTLPGGDHPSIFRYPLGEVCEIKPTTTTNTITTETSSISGYSLNPRLTMGIGYPVFFATGVIGALL